MFLRGVALSFMNNLENAINDFKNVKEH